MVSHFSNALMRLATIPAPTPSAPPGVTEGVTTLLGWLMWGGLVIALAGLIVAGAMLAWNNQRGGGGSETIKSIGFAVMAAVIISSASAIFRAIM